MSQTSDWSLDMPPDEPRPFFNQAKTAADSSSTSVDDQARVRNAIAAKSVYTWLYTESHAAKVWKLAQDCLVRQDIITEYPEHVPANVGRFESKPIQFWTCAFLPGCLFAILERSVRFPRSLPIPNLSREHFRSQLLDLCRKISDPLHDHALRKDSHDLGFMMLPLRMDFELSGSRKSIDSIIRAAHNLSSRFSKKTGAIRSWNQAESKTYSITNVENNFLIIIDSMANMDLLFFVGDYTGDQTLTDKAVSHCRVVIDTLVRADFTTYHVANLNPMNGQVIHQFTHQGYSDSSCWSRGQAWAVLGFAEASMRTGDPIFLATAISLANEFILRLSRSTHSNPYVPPWDFDAPVESGTEVLRDTSAGMIAANGLLLLHQTLQGQSPFLEAVLRIVKHTLNYSLSYEAARFEVDGNGKCTVPCVQWEAILMHSTANNNENAVVRYSDVGLIYSDYYFLELGNKLLRMGFA